MKVNDDVVVGRSFVVAVAVRNDDEEAVVMILADLRAAVLASKLNIIIYLLFLLSILFDIDIDLISE